MDFARSRRDETAHGKRSGEGGRTRSQRQAGTRRNSRNRIHRPGTATAEGGADSLPAKCPDVAGAGKNGAVPFAARSRRQETRGCLLLPARRGASVANGKQFADPHNSSGTRGARTARRADGL